MPSLRSLKLLFLSTSVGPLGSGLGGGVELTLKNMARSLAQCGHHITVVAPAGSMLDDFSVIEILGDLQMTAQSEGRDAWITMPGNSVLAQMWDYARQVQDQYDLILNFAYDWLPFYLTPFFVHPVAHLVSMGSLTDAMDQVIGQVIQQFPHAIAVHSRAQAETFAFGDQCHILGNGFDLSQYTFCPTADNVLGWVGRLAPEKGLEDAVVVAEKTGIPLKIWGVMQDVAYWQDICDQYPNAPVSYEGFLPTAELQQELGKCRALLMTPRWVEAFGNVAIEALACGVPVIAYDRGGPSEIVQPGQTGWLVSPDDVNGLVEAIAKLDQIDRAVCRQYVEAKYSLEAMGDRLEAWFSSILKA
ncbi:MAG: glycosyltransferase family 4 protein [Leptolyngbyaceae cyanobacterium bins.349]|nr:glycosyltransferase family 4 protein [Leptolyngbyaceae cyanobacterium bins.349]